MWIKELSYPKKKHCATLLFPFFFLTFEFFRIYVRVNKKSVHIIRCRFTDIARIDKLCSITLSCAFNFTFLLVVQQLFLFSLFALFLLFPISLSLSLSLFSHSLYKAQTHVNFHIVQYIPIPSSYLFALFPLVIFYSFSKVSFSLTSLSHVCLKVLLLLDNNNNYTCRPLLCLYQAEYVN